MNPQTFLDEFGAVANAPGGVQRLREMILQLAVMGKLVEQNPDDEAVSELLQRINKEKDELIKAKVVKKDKKQDQINQKELYAKIPNTWEWVRLQSIGNIFNGNSISARIKKEKYAGKKNGLPYIATKDVEYGFTPLNYENGVKIPVDEPKFKIAHAGAVLVCAEGGSAGRKCGITTQDICFGNKLYALEAYDGIEPKFLLSIYLSPSFFRQFQQRMTGIIGGISLANFSAIPVPLPPLEEQKRIVAKVDQLMALCDQLENQQQKRSELVKSTRIPALEALSNAQGSDELQTAWKRVEENLPMIFEAPEDVEDLKKCIRTVATSGLLSPNVEFVIKKLEDVISFGPKNGLSPRGVDYETNIKVFTLSATTKSFVDLSKFKYVEVDIEDDSYLWLEEGDILIQRANSKEYVGVSAVFKGPNKKYIYPDLMMKIKVIPEKILVEYIHLLLLSPSVRAYMWERLSGTSSTMPKINHKVVKSIPINIPPLEEQKRIVEKTQALFSLCDTLQNQLKKSRKIAEQLTQSVVENITGISTEKKEKMKIPKTELVTRLRLAKKPGKKDHAPLSAILAKNSDELSAKALWNNSGLPIDEFYRQLKIEMMNNWIEEPAKAEVRIVEE